MPRARSETPTAPRWGQPLESFPDISYFRGKFIYFWQLNHLWYCRICTFALACKCRKDTSEWFLSIFRRVDINLYMSLGIFSSNSSLFSCCELWKVLSICGVVIWWTVFCFLHILSYFTCTYKFVILFHNSLYVCIWQCPWKGSICWLKISGIFKVLKIKTVSRTVSPSPPSNKGCFEKL